MRPPPPGLSEREDVVEPVRTTSAFLPAPPAAVTCAKAEPDDRRPSWRPRPPLESTTYSIVPGRGERWTSAPASAPRSGPVATGEDDAISPDQRREIDAMYAALPTLSHYELLGVSRDVDPVALRANYDALLAAFHPHRFARKRMEPALQKLEIILAWVNGAYTTLIDPGRRAAYDAGLEKRAG